MNKLQDNKLKVLSSLEWVFITYIIHKNFKNIFNIPIIVFLPKDKVTKYYHYR